MSAVHYRSCKWLPDGGEKSSSNTLGSVFMMIVFALIGLIVCAQYIIRLLKIRKQRSLEKENQTEPARPVWLPKVTTKDIGTQTESSAIPVKAGYSPKRMEAKASRQAASRQAVLALEGLEPQHCQRQLQCHS